MEYIEMLEEVTVKSRIGLVDDHLIVRQGLKQLVNSLANMELVFDDNGTGNIAQLCLENDLDLLLLDITMPDINGIELIKSIKEVVPNMPIVIFTMHDENLYAVSAMLAGASGYLQKNQSFDTYIHAINLVLSGNKYISLNMLELIKKRSSLEEKDKIHDKLSFKEFQVLRLISRGLTLPVIAKELQLTLKTVSALRISLLSKLQLKTNADLKSFVNENQQSH
jgi:DNA-binding NarL/FixJ family response regulator